MQTRTPHGNIKLTLQMSRHLNQIYKIYKRLATTADKHTLRKTITRIMILNTNEIQFRHRFVRGAMMLCSQVAIHLTT